MQPNGDWNKELVHENNRYKLSEDKLALRIENVMYEDRGEFLVITLRARKSKKNVTPH